MRFRAAGGAARAVSAARGDARQPFPHPSLYHSGHWYNPLSELKKIAVFALASLILAGCTDRNPDSPLPEPAPGETRQRLAPPGEAAAVLRSGPAVPAHLPPGFTLYPAGEVTENTVFERAGKRRALLVFESAEPVAKIAAFYREQARNAAVPLSLDIEGKDRVSLGGAAPAGDRIAISITRDQGSTRVEISVE